MTVWTHNANGYVAGCRCDECRADNTARLRDLRNRRWHARIWSDEAQAWISPVGVHGKPATYVNHGCRCAPCVEAHKAVCRAQYQWHVAAKRAEPADPSP